MNVKKNELSRSDVDGWKDGGDTIFVGKFDPETPQDQTEISHPPTEINTNT